MSTEFVTLLDTTIATGSFSSEKRAGAGYHSQVNNVHTIVLELNNLNGTVEIQGTLEIFPGEKDWVTLKNTANSDIVYSGTNNGTFTAITRGNFIWIRAVGTINSGSITKIRFAI